MDEKIKKVHEKLSQGECDYITMEEIDILSKIIQKYITFKKKLKSINMDID